MAAVAASRYNDVLRPIHQELLQKEESRSHCDSPAVDMLCQCFDCWKICCSTIIFMKIFHKYSCYIIYLLFLDDDIEHVFLLSILTGAA